ncbi:MAG: DUF951 domain-containing protein [Chloroflexota bacterium]
MFIVLQSPVSNLYLLLSILYFSNSLPFLNYHLPITAMLPNLQLNDHLRLRKQHPCGSYEWTVTRLGADIGLECKGCGRRVMLTRRELNRRLKMNLTRHEEQKKNSTA